MNNDQTLPDLEDIRRRWTSHAHDLTCCRDEQCMCEPHISDPDVAALLAEVDRLAADAQRWGSVRSTVHRLDAQVRPGAKMADDDVEDIVVRVCNMQPRRPSPVPSLRPCL